jgi:hypothetical protein
VLSAVAGPYAHNKPIPRASHSHGPTDRFRGCVTDWHRQGLRLLRLAAEREARAANVGR